MRFVQYDPPPFDPEKRILPNLLRATILRHLLPKHSLPEILLRIRSIIITPVVRIQVWRCFAFLLLGLSSLVCSIRQICAMFGSHNRIRGDHHMGHLQLGRICSPTGPVVFDNFEANNHFLYLGGPLADQRYWAYYPVRFCIALRGGEER